MKIPIRSAVIAAMLTSAAAALAAPPGMGPPDLPGAGPPPGPPAFLSHLFPPKLVMEHQQELALRPAQLDAIKQAMRDAQKQLLDLQWQLDAEFEALGKVLEAPQVDETAVLKKLDVVTEVERQVKRANFTLLVRVKNQLDPEQQAKLKTLAPLHEFAPHGPPL